MIDDTTLARHFQAISHPRRTRIFRLLCDRSGTGRSFQDLQAATGLCDSSLVHHLRQMERLGLLRRRRHGGQVIYGLETGGFAGALAEALRLSRKTAVRRAA